MSQQVNVEEDENVGGLQSSLALEARLMFAVPDFLHDIAEFHEKFELTYNGPPRALPGDLLDFRFRFGREELVEWRNHGLELDRELAEDTPDVANITHHLEHQLDAIVDQLYVNLGTAYLQGFLPMLEQAWVRVHEANMKKVRRVRSGPEFQDSGRAPEYDVVKPVGWEPPSHVDLIEEHAHK